MGAGSPKMSSPAHRLAVSWGRIRKKRRPELDFEPWLRRIVSQADFEHGNGSLGAINRGLRRGLTGWQAMLGWFHRHRIDGSESAAGAGEQGDGEERDEE